MNEKRYPINLTVEQVALVLRALSQVRPSDSEASRRLSDELANVKSMSQAGMSKDEITYVLDNLAYNHIQPIPSCTHCGMHHLGITEQECLTIPLNDPRRY